MIGNQKFYPAKMIMRSKDQGTLRIIDLWKFRSSKSHKWYIVEVEHFPENFFGLKFYWKGVAESKDRYSLLTNDYEPRTIVCSCINIMYEYFRKNDRSSFGFVGARDLIEPKFLDGSSKRFRFYRRMMLSIFGSKTIAQCYDVTNSMYLLVNRKMLDNGNLSMSVIETEISRLYVGDYSFVLEP